MPRMSKGGWEDYIPASGEGRALVEVKGKIGKGAGMRRFSRRGSRFRGTKRSQRYWVPHMGDAPNTYLLYHEPVQAASIDPFGGADPEVIQATIAANGTYNSAASRLLMFQGAIHVLCRYGGNWSENYFNGAGLRMVPLVRLFYWWQKVKWTGSGYTPPPDYLDVSTNQRVWSASPGIQGALKDIMMRKDVISWGFRNIRPINPFNVQYAYNGTAVQGYVARADMQFQPPNQQFIPLPRIPRRGYMLFPGEQLRCYVTPVEYDMHDFFDELSGDDSAPPTLLDPSDAGSSSGLVVQSRPMFRALFAR